MLILQREIVTLFAKTGLTYPLQLCVRILPLQHKRVTCDGYNDSTKPVTQKKGNVTTNIQYNTFLETRRFEFYSSPWSGVHHRWSMVMTSLPVTTDYYKVLNTSSYRKKKSLCLIYLQFFTALLHSPLLSFVLLQRKIHKN